MWVFDAPANLKEAATGFLLQVGAVAILPISLKAFCVVFRARGIQSQACVKNARADIGPLSTSVTESVRKKSTCNVQGHAWKE